VVEQHRWRQVAETRRLREARWVEVARQVRELHPPLEITLRAREGC
jgi:hypothetical protein